MEPTRELSAFIDYLLEQIRPRRLAAVGATARQLLAGYAAGHAERELHPLDPATAVSVLPEVGPVDFAFVTETLPQLAAAEAEVLLSRLRDIYARRILVGLEHTTAPHGGIGHREMIGYGFTSLGLFEGTGGKLELFEFDIATYKTTPEWLNSRNWANPDLFDKYRW